MWMSDVHSVGGYTFAASPFFPGPTGWQVLASMLAGILAVYCLMNLIGLPSQRLGIPFPAMARVSFGMIFNAGDRGWLIGVLAGGLLYRVFSARQTTAATA